MKDVAILIVIIMATERIIQFFIEDPRKKTEEEYNPFLPEIFWQSRENRK